MNVLIDGLGEHGGDLIQDTSQHDGSWQGILIVEAATFTTLISASISGTLTGFAWPAGAFIPGRFSTITLTSGKVLADRAAP